MSNKTVFVLGAGFSMDAGAPSQAAIVEAIYELKSEKKSSKINTWIRMFDSFVREALMISKDQIKEYPLEDIYTPIDRSISDGIPFKNYTVKKLIELRDVINRLIILAVRTYIERQNKPKDSLKNFGDFLIKEARYRLTDEKSDRVSVITTNWDIMLDNYLNNQMKKEDPVEKAEFCGVVDYCCYISSLDPNDHKIKPGLYAIGKGGYNLKLLKLHGSLNWMQCPICQRLYVKYYTKFNGGYVFKEKHCRHCEKNFEEKKSGKLETNLVMPTFLKDLSNIQNKLIWQNAGIELSEASKVVFIGYSLPLADFEFKQLLSRMIRKDAKIEVVLMKGDDPHKNGEGQEPDKQTAGFRYKTFFSGRDLKMHYDGVGAYVKTLV